GGPAHQARGLRRQAHKSALAGGHRAEGLRLLQDRQPQQLQARRPGEVDRNVRDEGDIELHVVVVIRFLERFRQLVDRQLVDRQLVEWRGEVRVGHGVDADIGIFGGSGFYEFLDGASEVTLTTPFGPPSAPITVTEIGGRRVAFLPRHGRHHEFAPASVPARANVWAMRMLGVRQLIGPCAAGSLSPDVHPGEFVVLDQLVDRTSGRADTYYDAGDAHHVSFADPYCPVVAQRAAEAGERAGVRIHTRGTVV